MIVTICTSYKFIGQMFEAQRILTDRGCIVLMPAWNCDLHDKEWYMDLHRKKIDMSDAIYVVNVDGYIGESVHDEIEYAKSKGKIIMYKER